MELKNNVIVSLDKKDKNLIFVTAPVANVSMGYIKNYELIHNEIASFAKENDVPYIDYNIINMEEGMFDTENFRDDAHLNDSGVKILDAHFNEWLSNVLGQI